MPLKPIVLKGEQKRVLFLPVTEPIQIRGVAGSGKTTVALYRAKHLLETSNSLFEESKVAIFTYNKTLTAYINTIKHSISGGYQKDSDVIVKRTPDGLNVSVLNFDKYAFHFLTAAGLSVFVNINEMEAWKRSTIRRILDDELRVMPESRVLKRTIDFYIEEFSWIKGKLYKNETDYLLSKRTGRGNSSLNETARKRIWKVYERYRAIAKSENKVEFDDYPDLMLTLIESNKNYIPPFTHIIIDEAQDLTKAQVLALSKLVSPETKSITLIADAAQKIYKKGFTWTEVGIEVRGGRTLALKKNYRNTEAILNSALSLLNHEPDRSEFTEAEPARLGGQKPLRGIFKTWDAQMSYLVTQIKRLHNQEVLTVILHRDWAGMQRISRHLTGLGIENEIITGGSSINFDNGYVKICTLSSVKGLEFDNVFIVDLNKDVIPYPSQYEDEDEKESHINTERRLLYTSMTRAKEYLILLASGEPSIYMNEIEKATVEEV